MNFPPYLHPELPPENVFGHRHKVECLRASMDRLRSVERPNLRVLDAGCGSGRAVTRYLARVGDDVLGIDMHQPSIDYAQRHFGQDHLRFICADLSTLPDVEGAYEVIVLADVLEHLDDPEAVLSAAVKRLAPGGMVLASIPNGRGPFEIESAIARLPLIGALLIRVTDLTVALLNKLVFRDLWTKAAQAAPANVPYNAESGHVQFFTQRRITTVLRNVGLQVPLIRGLSFVCGPFTNYFFGPSARFCNWNVRVAQKLPLSVVSAWYLECRLPAVAQSTE